MTKDEVKADFTAHPELRGKMFVPKGGGTAYTFSMTLLDVAGGYERLMREWELDE